MTPVSGEEAARMLGEYGARIAHLEKTLDAVSDDVKAIRQTMDQFGGGWKVLLGVASLVGAAVSLLVSHFWGGKA